MLLVAADTKVPEYINTQVKSLSSYKTDAA